MNIEIVITGPLGVNTYIIENNGNAVIIDAGGNEEDIEAHLEAKGLKPVALVNTHGHFDHIGAIQPLAAKFGIPFYMHKDDEFLLAQGKKVMQMYGFGDMETPVVTNALEHGQKLELGGINIEIIHTPGHTPGGCCFYIKDMKSVITGDTLFLESVGRTDFPYSSTESLVKSINERLFTLDEATVVYPGHGAHSTIGHEKNQNPFM
jgi:glyoxylase-like metal-dependent hydrolase (beta-lactamase superfamily II)